MFSKSGLVIISAMENQMKEGLQSSPEPGRPAPPSSFWNTYQLILSQPGQGGGQVIHSHYINMCPPRIFRPSHGSALLKKGPKTSETELRYSRQPMRGGVVRISALSRFVETTFPSSFRFRCSALENVSRQAFKFNQASELQISERSSLPPRNSDFYLGVKNVSKAFLTVKAKGL